MTYWKSHNHWPQSGMRMLLHVPRNCTVIHEWPAFFLSIRCKEKHLLVLRGKGNLPPPPHPPGKPVQLSLLSTTSLHFFMYAAFHWSQLLPALLGKIIISSTWSFSPLCLAALSYSVRVWPLPALHSMVLKGGSPARFRVGCTRFSNVQIGFSPNRFRHRAVVPCLPAAASPCAASKHSLINSHGKDGTASSSI